MDDLRWASPAKLQQAGKLGQSEVSSWREQGFALVDDLLPNETLQALREDAEAFYPKAGTTEAAKFTDFGSAQRFVFPSESSLANDITLHPNLLGAVADLLGVSVTDLRLTQSDLWPKYGRDSTEKVYDNNDQRIHVDYPNHSLVHPPPWSRPEAVEIIIFLSEVSNSGGPTAVVPRQGDDDPAYAWPMVRTPGVAGIDYMNNRAVAEEYFANNAEDIAQFRQEMLYEREVKTEYNFGSVLFYRHDTWHRGTPVKDQTQRLVQNLTFKLARSQWIHVLHPGWTWSMYRRSRTMENLIAQSSVEQRTVLGFPPLEDEYWCEETIAAVEARYGAYGIDMQPYREALTI